jgi:hypothetical protein
LGPAVRLGPSSRKPAQAQVIAGSLIMGVGAVAICSYLTPESERECGSSGSNGTRVRPLRARSGSDSLSQVGEGPAGGGYARAPVVGLFDRCCRYLCIRLAGTIRDATAHHHGRRLDRRPRNLDASPVTRMRLAPLEIHTIFLKTTQVVRRASGGAAGLAFVAAPGLRYPKVW